MKTTETHIGPVVRKQGEVLSYSDTITETKSDGNHCKIIFQTVNLSGQFLRFMTIFVGYQLVSRERIE